MKPTKFRKRLNIEPTKGYRFDKENHVHTFNGKPLTGASTISGILPKVLTWWASGKAVELFGWRDPKKFSKIECLEAAIEGHLDIVAMIPSQYLEHLDKAYRNHSTSLGKSATKGTDLHTELEGYVKDSLRDYKGVPPRMMGTPTVYFPNKVRLFAEWSFANVEKFLWAEGHCYHEDLWLGGIVDCGAILKDGSLAVIDFKSSPAAYFNHFAQVGGYDLQLTKNGVVDAEGNKIMDLPKPITKHLVIPFGAKEFDAVYGMSHPKTGKKSTPQDHKEAFELATGLYRIMNKVGGL